MRAMPPSPMQGPTTYTPNWEPSASTPSGMLPFSTGKLGLVGVVDLFRRNSPSSGPSGISQSSSFSGSPDRDLLFKGSASLMPQHPTLPAPSATGHLGFGRTLSLC